MNNKVSLKEWLNNPRIDTDYTELFYGLHMESHRAMKSSDSYIPYFDLGNPSSFNRTLSQVQVNWMNARDVTCMGKMVLPLEDRAMAKQLNIDFLALFAIGLYLGYDYHNGLLNKDFVEGRFNDIKTFLPEEDRDYYEAVIVNHKYEYYNEYRMKQNISPASERGHQMVKGGSGHTTVEDDTILNKNAAFSQTAFLSIAFFSVAMITISIVLFILR